MPPEPIGIAVELTAAAATGMELSVLSLAAYLALSQQERTAAEAAACALVLPLMFLSAVFQAVFIVGIPTAAVPVELLAVAVAAGTIHKRRADIPPLLRRIHTGIAGHPVLAIGVGIALVYLLVQALVVPPGSIHWVDLAPVAYLETRGGFFSPAASGAGVAINPLQGSVNHTILYHVLLRLGTDRGLGLLGYWAYLSIGFSTYALARRYAWPPTALTAALVVMSLPRLVVQASGPGPELVPAAASLLVIVCLYRLLEQPNNTDLLMMVLYLLFSISGREMSLALPLVLGVLSALLLFRRHGGRIWRRLFSDRPVKTLAVLLPAVLLSQLWLPVARLAAGSGAAVLAEGHVPNTGGLAGALANLIRYGLESVHLTLPVEHLARWMFGISPMHLLEGIYRWGVTPLLGDAGAAVPFAIRWLPDETFSWFGPFGVFLIVPAVAYALWRGPRRIKAVALAMVVYGYMVALVPAWSPGNARFFTTFFVCGGFCMAFFLPPWRLTTMGKHVLQVLSIGLLVYAAAMNSSKPLVGYAEWLDTFYPGDTQLTAGPVLYRTRQSIWHRVAKNRWQFSESRGLFGDDRIAQLDALIGVGRPVGVLAVRPERAYPLLLRGNGSRFVPLHPTVSPGDLRSMGLAYLLYLDSAPQTALSESGMRMIWSAEQQGALPGALYRLEGKSPLHARGRLGGPTAEPKEPG